MEPKIGRCYLFYNTAQEVWTIVHQMYSNLENVSQLFEVWTALHSIKQESMSITKYFNTIFELWQELDLYHTVTWHYTNGDDQLFLAM